MSRRLSDEEYQRELDSAHRAVGADATAGIAPEHRTQAALLDANELIRQMAMERGHWLRVVKFLCESAEDAYRIAGVLEQNYEGVRRQADDLAQRVAKVEAQAREGKP